MLGETAKRIILKKQVYALIKSHPSCTAPDLVDWLNEFLEAQKLSF